MLEFKINYRQIVYKDVVYVLKWLTNKRMAYEKKLKSLKYQITQCKNFLIISSVIIIIY